MAATPSRRQREPHRRLAGVPGDQLGRGPVVEHPPVAHRDDPVAQRLGLVELVGDQQHRRTGVVELRDRRPDLAPGGRVEALGELVEDHQPGPVEQRQHQEQPLPLAAAQARERGPASVRQPELLQQQVAVGRPATGEQVDCLGDPEPVRQPGALQLAADLLSHPVGVPDRVQAQHPDLTRVLAPQPLEDLDRRGLAGTVGADQTEDLAVMDGEVEVVDDGPAVVGLGEPANGDDWLGRAGRGLGCSWPHSTAERPRRTSTGSQNLASARG